MGPVLGRVVALAEGFAAVDARPDGAALPEAPGALLAPGLPDTAPETAAVAPEPPGTVPPGTPWRGLADLSGVDVPSTLPAAGFSSAWPGTGTGSQGAPALPESSAATMTTAYAPHAVPTTMPIRRNVRLRRPDSSTNTGTSEAASGPSGRPFFRGSSWTVTSPGSVPFPAAPAGSSPRDPGDRSTVRFRKDRSRCSRPRGDRFHAVHPSATDIWRFLPPWTSGTARRSRPSPGFPPPRPACHGPAMPPAATPVGRLPANSSCAYFPHGTVPGAPTTLSTRRGTRAPTRLQRPIYPVALRSTNLAQAWALRSRCVIYGQKSCACLWPEISPTDASTVALRSPRSRK